MSFQVPNHEGISPFQITKTSFDARTHQFHKYSTTIAQQGQDRPPQSPSKQQDAEALETKRRKSFSPIKSLKIMQTIKKAPEAPFQAHPVMISSFTPEESQSARPLVNPKNAITYLLQHQTSRNPSMSSKRSDEQIDLIMKLLAGNRIWRELGYEDQMANSVRGNDSVNFNQMLKEICNSIVLLWSEIPNITQTKPNEMYLILEGKTFQYIHNQNATIKLKIHQNNDYIMIRKLIENDYFITLPPQIRGKNKSSQNLTEKYQLMVDEKTLMAKISDELFLKWIQKRLYERTRNLASFMKKIVLFQNLPDVVFHELSKFISDKKIEPETEIINANQKSKDIYFIKRGEVEFNLITTKADSQKKDDVKTQVLRDYDVFGMDTLHTVKGADITVQYSAKSMSQCQLFYIDKRILAIVISSFESQFKLQGKVVKSIDINSQIKGQNYLSLKQQILERNAQRIKTSERRIRDVKLQSFSRKRSRQINTFIPEKDRINERKGQSKSNEVRMRSSGGFNLLRSKNMRSQGSLLNPKDSTDSIFWNLKNKFEGRYENKPIQDQEGGICNNYVIPVMQEGEVGLKKSPTMRSNSTLVEFQRINKMQIQTFSHTQKAKSFGASVNGSISNEFGQKARLSLVSRGQSKSSFFEHSTNSGKIQSEIIKNHIEKKIKDELIKKTQEVLQRKTSIQRNSIKNIKKFYNADSFSPTKIQQATPSDKMTRKELTDDLLQRMANIKNYPLLSLIESERKKMDSLSKVKSKELKQVQQKREQQKNQKKFKISQKKIIILDISSLPDQTHVSEALNRFSSSGSRILSEQT